MGGTLAVFRADARPSIGTGHVVRCLTLADRLSDAGWRCLFATNAEAVDAVPALLRGRVETVILPPDLADRPEHLKESIGTKCDLLVVDHYGLDAAFEAPCRAWASRILVVDDLADRPHDCDFLLDQTYGREAAQYEHMVPAGCRLLLGSRWALLRPQFAAARAEALSSRRYHGLRRPRILVTMGGHDPDNYTGVALEALRLVGADLTAHIVLGSAALHTEEIRRTLETLSFEAVLHVGVSEMAALMSATDLCIGATGTVSWERCCLGLPCVALTIADNQRDIARALDDAGAIWYVGHGAVADAGRIAEAVRTLISDPVRLDDMSCRASSICDGRGAERVAGIIAND